MRPVVIDGFVNCNAFKSLKFIQSRENSWIQKKANAKTPNKKIKEKKKEIKFSSRNF